MTLETGVKVAGIALLFVIALVCARFAVRAMRAHKPKPMPTYVINVEDETSLSEPAIFNDLDMTTTCTTKLGNYEKFPEELGVI